MAVAAVVCIAAPELLAQDKKGLDAVGDEALVQEMSRYGMDSLLDRYFATSNVAGEQQASVRAMMSIRTLLTNGDKLPPAQRQQIVARIIQGADRIVPTLNDPKQLMQLATALITAAMERNANTIEYWGENPRSQQELRPAAELVAKVLDLCSVKAKEKSEKLVEKFGNNPSQAQLNEYTTLDNLSSTAQYTRLMADYYRAMSYPAGDPKRAQIADAAIEGLAEFDTSDSQIQPIVRLRIGKLQMVKGEYAAAKRMLETVATADKQIEPKPDALQQYEARYFMAVCDLLAKNADAATKSMQELSTWQEANLPQDKRVRDGAKTALAMLSYRIDVLRAATAGDDAAKKSAQAKADATLQTLAKERPELRSVIFEQLTKSLPDDVKVETLDVLILKALVQQGVAEQMKPEGEPVDRKVLTRAIAAAKELVSRKGKEGVDAELIDEVAIALPQFHEKLGQDGEAARAYLAYIETNPKSANGPAAMQNTLAAIARLKTADPQSADAEVLLDRALPVAVNAFGRKELAYDLGRRQQRMGKYAEAVAAYGLVPESDKRFVTARFFRLQAMKQNFDATGAKLDKAARTAQIAAIRDLAEDVQKRASDARTAGGADAQRYALIEARTRLILAGLLKDTEPARAVQQLEGFEKTVAGASGEDELVAEALFLRVNSQMAMGKNAEATQSLLQLLQTKGGDQGATIIFGLLTKLDSDLEVARKAGDKEKTKSLLDARAALSGPLVDWAKGNPDEKIRKYTYQYMVFDAATKQQAAMAEPEAAKRVTGLRQALALYDKLLDGENIKRWAATVDAAKVDVKYGDVQVLFAKAQVLFELAEYKDAAGRFARLLEDRKLGTPRIISTRDGEVTNEDNPKYWEATYKLYRANVEMGRDSGNPNAAKLLDDTKNGLKRLYIREGEGVGGEKWKGQFDQMRKELIPDFQVETAAS